MLGCMEEWREREVKAIRVREGMKEGEENRARACTDGVK